MELPESERRILSPGCCTREREKGRRRGGREGGGKRRGREGEREGRKGRTEDHASCNITYILQKLMKKKKGKKEDEEFLQDRQRTGTKEGHTEKPKAKDVDVSGRRH